MKNSIWVGLGLIVGLGFGFIVQGIIRKPHRDPVFYKKFDQKGDFALRDTERALSRADF